MNPAKPKGARTIGSTLRLIYNGFISRGIMKILTIKNVDPAFDAFHEILNSLGHESMLTHSKIDRVTLIDQISRFKPELIFINNTDLFSPICRPDGLEVAYEFERLQIPVCIWDFEAPYFVGGPRLIQKWFQNDYFRSFYFLNIDSFWTEEYRKHGNAADFLPFGVDPQLENFCPSSSEVTRFEASVSYIGSAFYSKAALKNALPRDISLSELFQEELKADILDGLSHQNYFPSDPRLGASLNESLTNLLAQIFQENADSCDALFLRLDSLLEKVLENFSTFNSEELVLIRTFVRTRILIFFSYFQVADRLERLVPEGLRIYGEGAWNWLIPTYSHPVQRLSYEELYSCYRGSQTIFCYTKKLFNHNVHERVLHILGAGGLPLSDYRKDIDLLFEPHEFKAYHSFEEAKDLIRFFSKHESARQNQIQKGRNRVFQSHTYIHRMKELVNLCAQHFGISSQPHRASISLNRKDWLKNMYHQPKVDA